MSLQRASPALPAQAWYFPPEKGRYEVAAGLSRFGKSFGQGPADQRIFQLDQSFFHYRQQKLLSRSESARNCYCTRDLQPAMRDAVVQFISNRLLTEHPEWFERDGERLNCRLTGETLTLRRSENDWPKSAPYADALDALACQLQEDLAIVSSEGERHWTSAIHLCFPNHWSAQEKIGRDFAGLHEPVAGMDDLNRRGAEMARIMLAAQQGLVRFAWGINWDDHLNHHPERPLPRQIDTDRPRAFVRVERQTIWGLADAGAALFTIRTYLYDCHEIRQRAAQRDALASAIESMTPQSLSYKGLSTSKDAFLAWLRQG